MKENNSDIESMITMAEKAFEEYSTEGRISDGGESGVGAVSRYFDDRTSCWKCSDDGEFNPNPVELTISDPCLGLHPSTLPGGCETRSRLDEIPEVLCVEKSIGWNTRVTVRRESLQEVFEILYGSSTCLPKVLVLTGDPNDLIELNGWWD